MFVKFDTNLQFPSFNDMVNQNITPNKKRLSFRWVFTLSEA